MRRDTRMTNKFQSSFLSCEKDIGEILKLLFVSSGQYGQILKKLLVINTKDCLDNDESEVIQAKIKEMSLAKLKKEGYIKIEPKLRMEEHAEVKSYIIITLDNFATTVKNPEYRDCTVNFEILCHTDYWDLGDYRVRPLKIAGYIDGILNNARLSGIGTLEFLSCTELVLNENLSGYSLTYRAVHGNDDRLDPLE